MTGSPPPGSSTVQARATMSSPHTAAGPLAGLKIVEMHAIGPVPFAGQLLAGLGADVVRISPPADPKLGVGLKPEYDLLNRGKRIELLDLKQPDGLAAARAILDRSDVMLEGFRPGVIERIGLAPATLLASNPRLVIGRLSGWGARGAMAERAGHDINYLALAGVLNAIGTADAPVPPLNVVADFGGGAMHLVVGVLAQLVRRSIGGRGGEVTSSILAGTVGLTPMFHGMLAGGYWNLQRCNNLLDGAPPFYRVYRTRDDRFVAVGALEAKFYQLLLQALELQDEVDARRQHDRSSWPQTIERFAQRFAQRTRDEWAKVGEGTDACLSPVLDFVEAAAHPHNRANALYADDPFARPGRTITFDEAR